MSSDKKKKAWAENGLEDWGAYMAAKKEKLEDQFEDAAKKEFQDATSLFRGIAIFVNGYTNPCADELKRLMMAHGGIYHHYMRSKITTHIIASNLPYSKIIAYRKSQNPLPICKPEWITDSINAQKLLDWRPYVLYSNCSKTQPQLRFNDKSNRTSSEENKDSSCMEIVAAEKAAGEGISAMSSNKPEFLSEFYNNSRLHHISTMGMTLKDYVTELREKSDGKLSGLESLLSRIKEGKSEKRRIDKNGAGGGGGGCCCSSDSEEDLFESEDSGTRRKAAPATLDQTIIMHIDMDCFFVSVGLRKYPELKGFPIAVAHARGNGGTSLSKLSSSSRVGGGGGGGGGGGNEDATSELGSMSEIASCSYEARKAGVKNGMFLGQALKLCPKLRTIKYDFQAYKEVSYALYDTVASYTLLIEAVSCDEMYADVTKLLAQTGLTPLQFANIIRDEIKVKTQCPVSTGFGCNKLQARIATRTAKPDGQFHLENHLFQAHVATTSVTHLPGVGYSTMKLLNKINVHTCSDLEKIALSTLQREFGTKTGESLYNMCRGIDNTKLAIDRVRKSVSAEVNYGIRFETMDEAHDFLRKLSDEVCTRLQRANSKGRSLALKLMVRAKDAPRETLKFMGHGVCDNLTRSKNLIAPVDDPVIITREVMSLWGQMQQRFEDVRGVGIQISRLESTRGKSGDGGILKFIGKTKRTEKDRVGPIINYEAETTRAAKSQHGLRGFLIDKKNSEENGGWARASGEKCRTRDYDESVLKELPKEIRDEILGERQELKKLGDDRDSGGCSGGRQTRQDHYFKSTKSVAAGGRSEKASMPPIEDIDMSVLIELPEDIRNEIINEYRSKKQEERGEQRRLGALEKNGKRKSTIDGAATGEEKFAEAANLSFSQIDPDFLAALSDDVKDDVEMYCMVKKKEKLAKIKSNSIDSIAKNRISTKLSKKDGASSSKTKSKIGHDYFKAPPNNRKNAHPTSSLVEMKENSEKLERNNDKNWRLVENKSNSDDTPVGASVEQTREIISHHSNFIGNKKTITEEQEMVASLVNYLFTLPRQQVKMQIQSWIYKSDNVNEIDLLSLATFLSMLPKKKRLEDLHVLLKTMHRCITKTASCVWHETFDKMVFHVQHYMQIEYKSKMMLPSIVCDRCQLTRSTLAKHHRCEMIPPIVESLGTIYNKYI